MLNRNSWLEEQLNEDYRREAEHHAERERQAQNAQMNTFWRWMQEKGRR